MSGQAEPSGDPGPNAKGDRDLHQDGYRGQARLTVGGEVFDVQVELRGRFEPIDGRYHWYGRVAENDQLARALGGMRAAGTIQTPQGNGRCEIAEPDTWNRYRVAGYSTPPFRLPEPT
jgi:Domain of unknown function (DUF4873)